MEPTTSRADRARTEGGASSTHSYVMLLTTLNQEDETPVKDSCLAISAVIFLVSAEYDMATSYIIGRVENNDYGLAIAYSTTLIFVMLSVVGLMRLIVGRTEIGRRTNQSPKNK